MLQLILAAGTAAGLVIAWSQMEGLKMSDLGIVADAKPRLLRGGAITVFLFCACLGCIILVPRL